MWPHNCKNPPWFFWKKTPWKSPYFVQPLWIRPNFYDKNRWITENALQNRLEWRVRRNANETIKHPTKNNKENTTAHSPTGQKTTENTRKTTYIKLGGLGYGWPTGGLRGSGQGCGSPVHGPQPMGAIAYPATSPQNIYVHINTYVFKIYMYVYV